MVAPQAIARGDGDPVLGLAAGTGFAIVGLRSPGAHSAIYDAWDAARGDPCVLKIARCESHALGSAHNLVLREAALMRKAPPAVKDRGAGVHEPAPSFAFLAMDLVTGQPVTRAEAPLGERAQAACRALSELHGAGVFHGDIKPAHLVFGEGRVTLLDFGSAAFADRTSEAVRSTTPAYAAPERELTGPSAASDVYGLGCVLFEMAVGVRPFARLSGTALAEAHAKQRVSCEELPRELRAPVRGALEKRASDRPTAAELAAAVTC